MLTEEERVRDLIREMYERAESAPWSISAEDIRSKQRRRTPQWPNPKMLVMVAAVILLLAVLLGVGVSRSRPHPAVARPAAARALCQDVGAFVDIQPYSTVGMPNGVLTNAEHAGYPSLDTAAIRFQRAIAQRDSESPTAQEDQSASGVSAAASQVLAVCRRLGI
jgi:hypothetical protein